MGGVWRFRGPPGDGSRGDREYATIALIAVTVLVFVATLALGGLRAAGSGPGLGTLSAPVTKLSGLLGVYSPAVARGEYWRLVTAMFVHFGVVHIALNMVWLFILGRDLEPTMGRFRFTTLYLVCGAGGNVAAYLFGSVTSVSGGASGAIYGLLAAMIVVRRQQGQLNRGLIVLIVIFLVWTFAEPNISIFGHLGGLVIGALAGVALAYLSCTHHRVGEMWAMSGIAALLVVLTLVRTSMLEHPRPTAAGISTTRVAASGSHPGAAAWSVTRR
jgi:membrane associated rhomboid family serine protease